MNFTVAPVHKALVSASKVCHKVIESSCIRGILHKHTNEWIGFREEKGIHVFRWMDFSGNGRNERPG